MKDTFSIFEAKTKFSELIRYVQRQKRVLITHRGNPVAYIVPYHKGETPQGITLQLIENGEASPAAANIGDLPRVEKRSGALKRFLEERERE